MLEAVEALRPGWSPHRWRLLLALFQILRRNTRNSMMKSLMTKRDSTPDEIMAARVRDRVSGGRGGGTNAHKLVVLEVGRFQWFRQGRPPDR